MFMPGISEQFHRRQSAVEGEDLAGHEAGVRGQQEGDGPGRVGRITDALERMALGGGLALRARVEQRPGQGRVGEGRSDGINADAGSEFCRERPSEAFDRALGRGDGGVKGHSGAHCDG